jgi:hypothetical protein
MCKEKVRNEIRAKVHNTLVSLRELMHSEGKLSSRQEALDEVCKLFFAHFTSILNSGSGLSEEVFDNEKEYAHLVKKFVEDKVERYLSKSPSYLKDYSIFHLKLEDSDNLYAKKLITCFKPLDRGLVRKAVSTDFGLDIINEVFGQFMQGSFINEKDLGQYLTPPEVVDFMVRLAMETLYKGTYEKLLDPLLCKDVGLILDPSCGVGTFLTETIRYLHKKVLLAHGKRGSDIWLENMMESVIVGVDKSERMIRLALINLSLFGKTSVGIKFCNALGTDEGILDLKGKALVILTNPPFGAEVNLNDTPERDKWGSKKIPSEVLFIDKYVEWLKPGGSFLAVVPDSVLNNKGLFQTLRGKIRETMNLKSVVSLPSATFGAAGTTTKTSILHMVKISDKLGRSEPCYFSVCNQIGFRVKTISSQKVKVCEGENDLEVILKEVIKDKEATIGRFLPLRCDEFRWDALYHTGLTNSTRDFLIQSSFEDVYVRDVAFLSKNKVDASKYLSLDEVNYIEISSINGVTHEISPKIISYHLLPSRAKKLVKHGDVLVSTVRPERKVVGVVPSGLSSAICSTGLAVLTCNKINPFVLALLLQSDKVTQQIVRNSTGISYPAILEDCLLDIKLPIGKSHLFGSTVEELEKHLNRVNESRNTLYKDEEVLKNFLKGLLI